MQHNADLKSLDDLLVKLGGAEVVAQTAGPCRLLLEHLQAARRGLLGSMRAEYLSSLKFAQESAGCIAGKPERAEAQRVLQSLINSRPNGDHIRSLDHMGSPRPADV